MPKWMMLSVAVAVATTVAGCTNSDQQAASDAPAATESMTETATATDLAAFTSGDEVTLAVPEMHCPFACYPKVKETLEGIDGVSLVELVPQEQEGVINDRRVVVKFDGDVSSDVATAALTDAGFKGSSVE
ncbi:heavy-metal-associated domain-containing protein [Thalassoglobus sp. JC818]|uniref:heavy-metal-associated domain-containing protein n=1 Tax=Thalassoglobus sp. JC818 TaxID=3232136 RepID=UPI00345A4DD4